MLGMDRFRDISCSFPNDFKISDHSIAGLLVDRESRKRHLSDVPLYSLDSIQDVTDAYGPLFRLH